MGYCSSEPKQPLKSDGIPSTNQNTNEDTKTILKVPNDVDKNLKDTNQIKHLQTLQLLQETIPYDESDSLSIKILKVK